MIRCTIKFTGNRKKRHITSNTGHTRLYPILTNENSKHLEELFLEAVSKSNKVQTQYDNLVSVIENVLKNLAATKLAKPSGLSTHTHELLAERKALYRQKRKREVKNSIATLSKKINKSIAKDKKLHRKNVLEKFIEKSGAIKKAYKQLRNTTEWTANIKNTASQIIHNRRDILKEATDFYKNLYSSKEKSLGNQNYYVDKTEYDAIDNLEVQDILLREIEHAINTQKKDKTPGEDYITNEFLKSFCDPIKIALKILFDNILRTRKPPKEWSQSTTILLHKKGDRNDLSNYRPISLMSNLYKVYIKIILNRLTKTLDEHQPREQAGFRKGYATIDHIHVISQLLEKAKEYGLTIYMCFIDFAKAFDTVEHTAIWYTLLKQGVQKDYLEVLHSIYDKCFSKIKLERVGPEFQIEKGVRQGDPLSPKIFSAVLEMVIRNLDWSKKGLNINGEYLSHLRFADDIVIFSDCPKSLNFMITELTFESRKAGLLLNKSKTKIMTNGDRQQQIVVEKEIIEYVNDYIYLGQLISIEDHIGNEVKRRIALAWNKYWNLKEVMKNNEINIKIKTKLFNTTILPCLIYGCQTWALRKCDEEKLAICQRKMERSMLGIRQSDKISNSVIRKKTRIVDVVEQIRLLKFKWAGHICRMDNNKWTKILTEWVPRTGKRKRGRPRRRWADLFTQINGPLWWRTARERGVWRELGEAYAKQATSTLTQNK